MVKKHKSTKLQLKVGSNERARPQKAPRVSGWNSTRIDSRKNHQRTPVHTPTFTAPSVSPVHLSLSDCRMMARRRKVAEWLKKRRAWKSRIIPTHSPRSKQCGHKKPFGSNSHRNKKLSHIFNFSNEHPDPDLPPLFENIGLETEHLGALYAGETCRGRNGPFFNWVMPHPALAPTAAPHAN